MESESRFKLPKQLNRKGCAMLAAAIVRQAVKDYKDALEMLQKVPDHFESRCMKAECEAFFCSERFQEIREFAPDVIPVDIMEVLKR